MNFEQYQVLQELYTYLEIEKVVCHECVMLLRKKTETAFLNEPLEKSTNLHSQCILGLLIAFGGVLNLPSDFYF